MEIATVVISAIGLFFAAVAAWGAVTTVRITREMRRDSALRAVLEALVAIYRSAHTLTLASPGGSSEFARGLHDAQSELIRSMSANLPFPDDVREALNRLATVEPTDEPERTVTEAHELWKRLSRQRLPTAPRP